MDKNKNNVEDQHRDELNPYCLASSSYNLKSIVHHATIYIENVKKDTGNDSIKISGIQAPVKANAVQWLYEEIVASSEDILRIASGLATIKQIPQVTETEIKQAFEMRKQGINTFLPEVELEFWD